MGHLDVRAPEQHVCGQGLGHLKRAFLRHFYLQECESKVLTSKVATAVRLCVATILVGLLPFGFGGSTLSAQVAPASKVVPAAASLFEDIHAVRMPKGEFGYRGVPGDILQLQDGRLLLVYGAMGAPRIDVPLGALGARLSTDLGRTWGDVSVIVPAPRPQKQGEYYGQPGLTRLANGEILLYYFYVAQVRPFYYAQTLYRRSTDDGKTWGDQLLMTPASGSNLGYNDKLVQLTSGRLVLPVEHEADNAGDDHSGYVAYSFFSDDNGYSWRKSSNVVDMRPVEAQEPHVVELKDGRLLMFLRTYSGCIAQAFSTDRGETWSAGELRPDLKLSKNSSAINVQRIPATGDLVLLRTIAGDEGRRTPFVSTISRDEGKTWSNERVIAGEPSEDYGYPSLTFVKDLALVLYHARDGLHVARIRSDWFSTALPEKTPVTGIP